MANNRDLNFIIGALDRSEKAFAKIAAKVDKLERRLDRLDGKRVNVDVDVDTRGADKPIRLTYNNLATLAAAAAAVAPAAVAGAAAFGAFGAVAAPSVIRVVKAFEDAGAGLDSLNARQLESAGLVQGLVEEYRELAEAAEPQALTAFNNAILTGHTLLRQFAPAMDAGGDALVAFTARANAEFSNPQWTEFFTFLGNEAPGAVADLSDVLFSLAGTAADLTMALAPLAETTVPLVGIFADVVGSVAEANPLLVQMAVTGVALRGAYGGLHGVFTNVASSLGDMTKEGNRARSALRLLGGAGAVVGITLMADAFSDARTKAEQFTSEIVNGAPNTRAALRGVRADLEQARRKVDELDELPFRDVWDPEMRLARARVAELEGAESSLAQQIDTANAAARRQTNVAGTIATALKTVNDEARSAEERTTALQTALDALFNPSIALFDGITQLKQGFRELVPAMKEAEGDFSGNTEASLQLRDAFSRQLTTVARLRESTLLNNETGRQARAVAAAQITKLYEMAGGNKTARAQVDALATSLGITTGKTNVSKEAFIRAARQLGVTRDRAERLWREYKKIPKNVRTRVTMPGGETAIGTARRLRRAINNIPKRRVVDVLVNRFENPSPPQTGGGLGGLLLPRAHGGSVLAGRSYLVGEKAPEILTIGAQNGTVTPLDQVSDGPGEITVKVYLGDHPVEQVVKRVVVERDRGIKRQVLAGAGGAR